MQINKVTTGFVTQTFDTEKGKFVSQEFTAGESVYENKANGEELSHDDWDKLNVNRELNFGPYAEKEQYLPFDMVQPDAKEPLTPDEENLIKDLLKHIGRDDDFNKEMAKSVGMRVKKFDKVTESIFNKLGNGRLTIES